MKIVILHRILLVFPFKKPLFLAIFVRFSQLKKIFSFSMENFRAKCYLPYWNGRQYGLTTFYDFIFLEVFISHEERFR